MSKFIFILFLFFCSLQAFSQQSRFVCKLNNNYFSAEINLQEKQETETVKNKVGVQKESVIIYDGNLCDVLAIKVSDLLNEAMFKKLLANV